MSNADCARLFQAVDWDEVRSCILSTEQEFAGSAADTKHYYELADALDAFLACARNDKRAQRDSIR